MIMFMELGAVSATLVFWTLAAAAIGLLGLSVATLCRRRSASERHIIWLSTVIGITAVPLTLVIVPGVQPTARHRVDAPAVALATLAEQPVPPAGVIGPHDAVAVWRTKSEQDATAPTAPVADVVQPASFSLWSFGSAAAFERAIVLLWLAGLGIAVFRYSLACQKRSCLFRNAQRASDESLISLVNRLINQPHGAEIGNVWLPRHRAALDIFISADETGPLVSGTHPPRLLLPSSFQQLTQTQQAATILHERAHILRGDEWIRRFLLIPRLLLWFHPLVAFCCRRVQLCAEQACDDAVLRGGCNATDYSQFLLTMSLRPVGMSGPAVAASGIAVRSQVGQRIAAILRHDIHRAETTWKRMFVFGSIGVLVALSVAVVRPGHPASAAAPADDDRQSAPAGQAINGFDFDQSEFEVISSSEGRAALLAQALERQRAVFSQLVGWKGTGQLEETFIVHGRTASQHEYVRTSSVEFAWSEDRGSLRVTLQPAAPTLHKDMSSGEIRELDEDLRINSLLRTDGYYRFHPNEMSGDYEGFTPRGDVTRVVERLPKERGEESRIASYLFDPTTMYIWGGSRIDEFIARSLESVSSERLWVGRRGDSSILIIARYQGDSDDSDELRLHAEVLLDAACDFMPVRAVMKIGGAIVQSGNWSYKQQNGISVPTLAATSKFGKSGTRVSRRVMSVADFQVNPEITEDSFALSQIGVRDGDRLLDRIENRLMLFEDGKLKLLDPGNSR